MKSFACGAVVHGCMATFEGETEQELLERVAEHARVDHGMQEIPDSVVQDVRSHIVTVP